MKELDIERLIDSLERIAVNTNGIDNKLNNIDEKLKKINSGINDIDTTVFQNFDTSEITNVIETGIGIFKTISNSLETLRVVKLN